jgi:riboflavin kinase/FMN adenylyltransferase
MVVTHGSLQSARGRCALTIGNFDGVHRGHRALIDRVTAKARELGLTSCVLTFEPHPREFFARAAAPARLTRLRDKLELMAAAGVKQVHIARFDARFAACSAARFVDEVLVRGLGMRWLLVGSDFRFGERRSGDFATLEDAALRHGFRLEAMPDVLFEGARVSSSAVRAALAAGDLKAAERLLGHPYTISGRVAHGAKLGRGLGFPTANIVLRRTLRGSSPSRWRALREGNTRAWRASGAGRPSTRCRSRCWKRICSTGTATSTAATSRCAS